MPGVLLLNHECNWPQRISGLRTEVVELEHADDRSVDRQLEQRREPSVIQGGAEQLQGIRC